MTNSANKFRLYTHPSSLKHDTGLSHPESISRIETLNDLFEQKGWETMPAAEAEYEWLLRAHDAKYLDHIQDSIPDQGDAYLDSDTVISAGSWLAALHAAGAPCVAVEAIASGDIDRAFCALRPPGHHAHAEHAEGFCLLNNIVIGALHAQKECGFQKIAIVDFDVNHGNGTDAIIRDQENMFFASTHGAHIYPGTGLPHNNIEGHILNFTMNAGDDGTVFRELWADRILPQLKNFTPDLIMISAGFDAHKDDPLAPMNLVQEDFEWITRQLVIIANETCNGRIISVLEGGYNLQALSRCVEAHIDILRN